MLVTSTANKIEKNPAFDSGNNIQSLWKICFPLMLSALSGTLMIFFARIFLAKFNTQAMVAATTASSVFLVFQFGATSIAMIAEVFVGQFNGARLYNKVSKPVWQMIWFSLACSLIMIPVGLWGSHWFIPSEMKVHGQPYFKWIMLFGPTFPLVSALSAFFVGRGKVKIVTFSIILGNLLNLILVLTLVFGIPNLIEPMGAKGAAIATGVAELCIALGLFAIFLNAEHREKFHSHRWQFDKALFLQCLKFGMPNAIGHMTAIGAWAAIMYLLAEKSVEHVTIMSIGLSIWSLFSFITEGLQKGVTAVASNCLGANKPELICQVFSKGLRLQVLLAMFLAIPLVFMPEYLVQFFIPFELENRAEISQLRTLMETSCRWLWIAYLFDGLAWVIDGILTAAGDTRFIMLMNSIGTWLFCIGPIYLFVIALDGSPILMLQLITVFCFILFASYFWRYKSEKWQNLSLICQFA